MQRNCLIAPAQFTVQRAIGPTVALRWRRAQQRSLTQVGPGPAAGLIYRRTYALLSSCSAVMRHFDHGDHERARAGDVQRS
jgi:hypothetical protein